MHPNSPQNQPDVFQGDQKSSPLPYEDNAISSPPISNLESKTQQPLHQSQTDNLFTTIAFSIYVMIIGCFFGAFILFFVLLVIKPTYAFSYLTLYSGLGIVVYGLGFIAWKVKIRSKLVNKQNHYQPAIFQQQVKSYLITFFVVNFLAYILLVWFLMILLGTFNGFGINFIDRGPNDVIIAFGEKGFLNQIRIYGLILFYTTLFVSLTIFLLYRWYKKWKTKANKILSNRRQTIAQAYNQSSSHLSPSPSSSTTPTNPVNQTNLTNPSKPGLQQLPLKDNDQKSSQLGNERITNNFGYEQKMVVSGDDQQLPTNFPSPSYITKTVGYESEFSQKMSWRNRQMRCQMQKNLVSNYVAHLKQLIKHQKIIQNQPVVSTFQPTFPPKINLTYLKTSLTTIEPNLLAVDKNYVKVSLPIEMANSTKNPLSLKQIMRFLRLDQPVLLQRHPLLVCQNHPLTGIVVFPKDGEKEFNCQPLSFDHYKIKWCVKNKNKADD